MENKLQSDCFLWHWNTFPEDRQMLFHVNNKGRNAIEGNKFKAMGVVKGVSDMIYIMPGKVLFIEFKAASGAQRPEQQTFEKKVKERGFNYIIIRTIEEFKKLILCTKEEGSEHI